MEPLTEKQQKVLKYIEGRLERNNPPSQREIARHFRLAQNAVFQLITYLRKKGYLEISSGHRGIYRKIKKAQGLSPRRDGGGRSADIGRGEYRAVPGSG